MNIIEAIVQAENGKLIRNGMLKRIGHFLKYQGNGIFYEYKITYQGLNIFTEYKYEIKEFSVGYILSNNWEAFDLEFLNNENVAMLKNIIE